uniref:Carbonic anhydrase n=1 Tax=Oxyrrhis marina TaxID=2969 RepID=B3U3W7_OXYMA|nr:carbonic anhydrase [Oxyrrhis marina]
MDRPEIVLGCAAVAIAGVALLSSMRSSSSSHDALLLQLIQDGREGRKPRGTQHEDRPAPDDESNSVALLSGFTMQQAREHAQQGASVAKARTPTEVLLDLQRGNARFWMGKAQRPEKSAFERRALIMQQYPSVAILGCSDSRVPVEIVFDQGLGDLFVVRVAGNGLDVSTSASLQFAIHHLKVKVVIVMGHEACGAIKAAQLDEATIKKEPADLAKALLGIKAGLDEQRLKCIRDPRSQDREAVASNVENQVEQLAKDPALMDLVNKDQLAIVGAFYEISSGIVDFFHHVSKPGSPDLGGIRKRPTK